MYRSGSPDSVTVKLWEHLTWFNMFSTTRQHLLLCWVNTRNIDLLTNCATLTWFLSEINSKFYFFRLNIKKFTRNKSLCHVNIKFLCNFDSPEHFCGHYLLQSKLKRRGCYFHNTIYEFSVFFYDLNLSVCVVWMICQTFVTVSQTFERPNNRLTIVLSSLPMSMVTLIRTAK